MCGECVCVVMCVCGVCGECVCGECVCDECVWRWCVCGDGVCVVSVCDECVWVMVYECVSTPSLYPCPPSLNFLLSPQLLCLPFLLFLLLPSLSLLPPSPPTFYLAVCHMCSGRRDTVLLTVSGE